MTGNVLTRNLLIWLGLFVLASLNGAVREVGIKRWIDEPWAHHLSALTAVLIFGSYVLAVWTKSRITTVQEAACVGLVWFLLTVLTETFVLNRWISKMTWEQILQSYNLLRGELWPLVLLWIGVLPLVVRELKGPAS